MNYLGLMVIMLSFLAILFCLFAFWLLLISYRFYSRYSLIITEMAKVENEHCTFGEIT